MNGWTDGWMDAPLALHLPTNTHQSTHTCQRQVLDLTANPLARLAVLDLLASLPKLHTLTLQATPLKRAVVKAAVEGEEKWERDAGGGDNDASVASSSVVVLGEGGEARYRALVAALLPRLLLLDGRKLPLLFRGGGGGGLAATAEVSGWWYTSLFFLGSVAL
jgi:hypothetical protein